MRSLRLVAIALSLIFSARLESQEAIPEIAFDASADILKLPADVYLGEVAGVATNSKGQIFVYTRTGNPTVGLGNSRLFTHGGSRLFQFDRNGAFVREIGQGLYAFLFAHAVRVDPQDNIWIVDEGSNQVVKFSPDGRVLMVLGRKPEAVTIRTAACGEFECSTSRPRIGCRHCAGGAGDQFVRPSDVAFDADGNIFVADGHGANARIAKFDRNWPIRAVVGHARCRSRAVQHAAFHRNRCHRGTSTWRIQGTSGFRSSTAAARSNRKSPTSASRWRFAYPVDLINIFTVPTRATSTAWTTRRSTSSSWTARWSASSAKRANLSKNSAWSTLSIAGQRTKSI